ncbi:MAG: DUF4197 domain-containing protein [Vicingaceae bacterium]
MNLGTILTTTILSLLLSCGNLDEVLREIDSVGTTSSIPTQNEMANGLKAALVKGTEMGVTQLHQSGGYLNDPKVKIPFPKDLEKVKNTLVNIGLEGQVDKVVNSLNEAAEDAVIEAKPLFVNAIKEMTIADAKEILFGTDTAATSYLKSKTRSGLEAAFQPKIKSSLDKVNATKYWGDVIGTYNKIPLTTKVNEDLPAYVTDKAIDGLFLQIAQEEEAIRENPLERTTDVLKRIFGYADSESAK